MTKAVSDRSSFRVLICTSPKAGNGSGRERIAMLISALSVQGIQAEVTTDIAYVRERTCANGQTDGPSTIVVTAGGDGTLSLVSQNTPLGTVLVPMPLGTENLVAKQFGHTAKVELIVETLRYGRDHSIDAGQANGKLFLVMATCGFDAEVVRAMHLRRRGHINRFSYTRPILRTLQRYAFPPLHVNWIEDVAVTAKTPDVTCRWAMVFNLPQYAASLPIETNALGDDGQLDFCGLEKGSIVSGLRYLGGIIASRHIQWPDVTRKRIGACRITSPARVAYQLDGDYAGHLPLEIRVLPKQITLRLPPQS